MYSFPLSSFHLTVVPLPYSASKGVPEREYQFDLDLYDEIIPEETKKSVTSRAIVLILRKKQLQAEFWPRLTKEKVKNNWIKTDFSKVCCSFTNNLVVRVLIEYLFDFTVG
jgi:hypothetical protein